MESGTLARGALQSADILLMSSVDPLAASIRTLDGSAFSHAALCLGLDEQGRQVALEAKAPAVVVRDVDAVVRARSPVFVYRHKALGLQARRKLCNRVKSKYANATYAGSALLLNFGLVCMLGFTPRQHQDMLSAWARDALTECSSLPARRVTCTEVVARAFADAGYPLRVQQPDDRIASLTAFLQALEGLWIHRREAFAKGQTPGGGPESILAQSHDYLSPRTNDAVPRDLTETDDPVQLALAVYATMQGDSAIEELLVAHGLQGRRLLTWSPEPSASVPGAEALNVTAGIDWPLALVTPRMLAESPDLNLLGELVP